MQTWTTSWGPDHQVAPGEAHERLALVERRHAVLRKAVERSTWMTRSSTTRRAYVKR